jgi:hypothetical protein
MSRLSDEKEEKEQTKRLSSLLSSKPDMGTVKVLDFIKSSSPGALLTVLFLLSQIKSLTI